MMWQLESRPTMYSPCSIAYFLSSSVFEYRCPPDEVLLTSFIGGSQRTPEARLPDDVLFARLNEELRQVFGTQGQPTFQRLFRWERAIPQYEAVALPAQQQAADFGAQKLHFCANWLGGTSVVEGLRKGQKLAKTLVDAG